jgi:hypothetical protein
MKAVIIRWFVARRSIVGLLARRGQSDSRGGNPAFQPARYRAQGIEIGYKCHAAGWTIEHCKSDYAAWMKANRGPEGTDR